MRRFGLAGFSSPHKRCAKARQFGIRITTQSTEKDVVLLSVFFSLELRVLRIVVKLWTLIH
jgi:hypothetical protein